MAQQTINLGTVANDGTGDTLRTGGDKINDNFTECYAADAAQTAALAAKAPLASPTFTGTPAGPTAAPGTNTMQLASTAFVQAAVSGLGSVRAPAGWNPGVGMVREWYGDAALAGVQQVGWATASSGTSGTPAQATTNRLTRMNRITRLSTSANVQYGWRWDAGATMFNRDAGFVYEAVFGFEVGATIAQKRALVGWRATDGFPGDSTDPSSLANIVGIGADTADANWQIMHNDGSGTATKVDTGWPKTVGDVIYVRITASSSSVKVYAERYAAANLTMTPTATFAEATYSSDIPSGSTEGAFLLWGANGAVAENGTLAGVWQRVVSPF